MKALAVALARGGFCQVEELGANSLPSMGGLDKKLIDPGTLAAVFQAVVETDDQIADGGSLHAGDIDDAKDGILQKLRKIRFHNVWVEGLGPGIVVLHMAHQDEQVVEVARRGAFDGDGHGRSSS